MTTTEIIEYLGGSTGGAGSLCWIPLLLPFCIAGLVLILITGAIIYYANRQDQSGRIEERDRH